jgi:hypothetical protein
MWQNVEGGQVTPHNLRVWEALMGAARMATAEAAGVQTQETGPSPARTASNNRVIPYPLNCVIDAGLAGQTIPTFDELIQKMSAGSAPKNRRSARTLSSAERIRFQHAYTTVVKACQELRKAFPRPHKDSGAPLPNPSNSEVQRLLGHEILEIRYCALALSARAVTAAAKRRGATNEQAHAAYELSVGIQKLLAAPLLEGGSILDPTQVANPTSSVIAALRENLAKLQTRVPFDGVQLALHCPGVVFGWTAWDRCLPESGVSARENQKATLVAVAQLVRTPEPFLVINRAAPGQGKSSLLPAIVNILVSAAEGRAAPETLYVCAGQGFSGCLQFMQALYSASLTFSYVYLHKDEIRITQQHRLRGDSCTIFVGTADALCQLLQLDEHRGGILLLDEPTYGADIPNSPAVRQTAALLAALEGRKVRLLLLGATIPPVSAMPVLTAACGGSRLAQIRGGPEALQLACNVYDLEGVRVLPHYGCTSSIELENLAEQLPDLCLPARMYTVAALVEMAEQLSAQGENAPVLSKAFAGIQDFTPTALLKRAQELLRCAAQLPLGAIEAFCRPVAAPGRPIDLESLAVAGWTVPTLVVHTDPAAFAHKVLSRPLLEALSSAGIRSARKLHEAYAAACGEFDRRTAQMEKLQSKKVRPLGRTGLHSDVEQSAAHADLEAPEPPKFPFPEWGQIGSHAHHRKFPPTQQSENLSRLFPPKLELVVEHDVPDLFNLLLLAGIGVLTTSTRGSGSSNRVGACSAYQADVLRRAAEGRLALIVTDHTGCFGANLIINAVVITPDFAKVCSNSTIVQAAGRLCRNGLTYSGELHLPQFAAAELLKEIQAPNTAVHYEAINLEKAFEDARIELQRQSGASAPLAGPDTVPPEVAL